MTIISLIILASIQALAELLPVSSSAHVILVGRFLGFDPTTPQGTFFLVMLHTGTMFAVLFYFRKRWMEWLRRPVGGGWSLVIALVVATVCTGIFGGILKTAIEKLAFSGEGPHEIESLFGNLYLIAGSLFAAGTLILFSSRKDVVGGSPSVSVKQSVWIGIIQGLCLPFRGFSRSGATISTGMLIGVSRMTAEDFSFALAVLVTPPVILREVMRMSKEAALTGEGINSSLLLPGFLGMVVSFIVGLFALRWLSAWLERGRWKYFGFYCIALSVVVVAIRTFAG